MGEGGESGRPGPIYDRAMRGLFEDIQGGTQGLLSLLGLPTTAPAVKLPATFQATTRTADLMLELEVSGQLSNLTHVEYVLDAGPDLVVRMLHYRALIMAAHRGRQLSQHLIVLRHGRVTGHREPGHGFTLDLNVVYLRELDSQSLLADPVTAPLASLAKPGRRGRQGVIGDAIRLVTQRAHPQWIDLLKHTMTLATIHEKAATLKMIAQEVGMTAESAETFAELFKDMTFVKIEAERLRQEGEARARIEMLTQLIRTRFGDADDLPQIVERLIGAQRGAAAVETIVAARSLDDLRR